ncbi:MAG: CHRD domain-containing protein [candidate division Zixibacteria bacterium]|nr:CHRD domain-containing protein [candidate division Zixibacteria bacterium]
MRKLASLALLLALFSFVAANENNLANSRRFNTHLTGDEHVPSVNTTAQGQANFWLSKEETSLHYKVIVSNIENVTAAHLHLGEMGATGPVIFRLFDGPTVKGRMQGVLAEGVIANADLISPLAGQTIDVLISRIESGDIYVNVLTTQNPNGEIRGQLN